MNQQDTSHARTWTHRYGPCPRSHKPARPGRFSSLVLAFALAALCGGARAQSPAAAGDVCLGGTGSGDVDGNGFVDLTDIATLTTCLTGPNVPLAVPVCKCFTTDADDDVDFVDAAAIMAMFSVPIGCTINDTFYAPGERGAYPSNCGVCNPDVSTTSWTSMAAGVLCHAGSGDACDPDELCTGASFKCPQDSFLPSGAVCRQGSGDVCDPDERCPGTPGGKCPPDDVATAGTVCRAAAYACDTPEQCSGVPGESCPPLNNRLCNDGEACSADGQCASGSCRDSVCVSAQAGCYVDTGLTVVDVCNNLEWEKKNGADANPGFGQDDPANPQDVDNIYGWAGECSISHNLCQPTAAAAAACAASVPSPDVGCDVCGAGEGTCEPAEYALGTIWEWLVALNDASFAGHNDWRIPTSAGTKASPSGAAPELDSIVDPAAPGCGSGGACIMPVFGPTVPYGYWAQYFAATLAWYVEFGTTGSTRYLDEYYPASVRAVRDRPPTCDDGFHNGAETDVDCGGGDCPPCDTGEGCILDRDCASDDNPCTSDVCVAGICSHPAGGTDEICRASAGVCDLAETCNGVSPTCPVDGKRYGDTCRPSLGICDPEETCDGVSNDCPPDHYASTDTVCGPATGICTLERLCDGNGTCAESQRRSPFYPCRSPDPSNTCDILDQCGTPETNAFWPDCGDDIRLWQGEECIVGGALGECQGTVVTGTCVPVPCRWDINCPDGRVCVDGQCVVQDTGIGSLCTGVEGSGLGTCSGGLFCCVSMEGDGVGSPASPGGTGRCAECCDSFGDWSCGGGLECCDGRCSDPDTDPHNCDACAYAGGVDCDDLLSACQPVVRGCTLGNCDMVPACPGGDACNLPTPTCTPCTDPLFCQYGIEPTCYEPPDFGCCDITCTPLDPQLEDCAGDICNTDTPCCLGYRCVPTCTNALTPFCSTVSTCQVDPNWP